MRVTTDNTELRGRGSEEPGVREGCFRAEWELAGIIQPPCRPLLRQAWGWWQSCYPWRRRSTKVIAEPVVQKRDALGSKMNFPSNLGADNGLSRQTGALHGGVHINRGLFGSETAQAPAQGGPLLELPELRGFKFAV